MSSDDHVKVKLITNATDSSSGNLTIITLDEWCNYSLPSSPAKEYKTTYSNRSNATIHFWGSYITVFGTVPSIYDNSSVTEYRSLYTLDDGQPVPFKTDATSQPKLNNVLFQPASNLADGKHTLVITNEAGQLLLDYFAVVPLTNHYAPSRAHSTNKRQSFVKLDDCNFTAIAYSNAYQVPNANEANYLGTLHNLTSGSSASLDFNGTSVAVYGSLQHSDSQQLPNITFIVDNSTQTVPPSNSQSFHPEAGILASPAFPPYLPDNGTVYQVLLWKSQRFGDGLHTLKILVNNGTLLLDFFLVETFNDHGSDDPYATQTPSSQNFSSGTTSPINATAITGGVLGSVAFILLLAVVGILLKRRSLFSSERPKSRFDSESSFHSSAESTVHVTAGSQGLLTGHHVDGSGRHARPLRGYKNNLPELSELTETFPPPYCPKKDQDLNDTRNVDGHNKGGEEEEGKMTYGYDEKFALFGQPPMGSSVQDR